NVLPEPVGPMIPIRALVLTFTAGTKTNLLTLLNLPQPSLQALDLPLERPPFVLVVPPVGKECLQVEQAPPEVPDLGPEPFHLRRVVRPILRDGWLVFLSPLEGLYLNPSLKGHVALPAPDNPPRLGDSVRVLNRILAIPLVMPGEKPPGEGGE